MNKKPGLESGFSLLDEWLAGDRTDVQWLAVDRA